MLLIASKQFLQRIRLVPCAQRLHHNVFAYALVIETINRYLNKWWCTVFELWYKMKKTQLEAKDAEVHTGFSASRDSIKETFICRLRTTCSRELIAPIIPTRVFITESLNAKICGAYIVMLCTFWFSASVIWTNCRSSIKPLTQLLDIWSACSSCKENAFMRTENQHSYWEVNGGIKTFNCKSFVHCETSSFPCITRLSFAPPEVLAAETSAVGFTCPINACNSSFKWLFTNRRSGEV